MGGSEDETTDAPAWLSRAAARYGGVDALAEELGSDGPREHVSSRGVGETVATVLEDDESDTAAPETVVADRGVDEVFAEIEAAAPDSGTRGAERRSAEDHPMLDTGPAPTLDDLADDSGAVATDGVDDLFEEFEEDDPAEVAAAAESDAGDTGGAVSGTHDGEAVEAGTTGARAAAGEDVESVPADLFEDLAAAVGDTEADTGTAGDGHDGQAGDAGTRPSEDEDDVDVFEWVETASSPMTGGDASTGAPECDGDRFDSLTERTAPAPEDVLDGAGDETTDVETGVTPPSGTARRMPDETGASADGLVGPEHAPDDLGGGSSRDDTTEGRPDTGSTPGAGGDGPAVASDDGRAGADDTGGTGDPATEGAVASGTESETAREPDALDEVVDGPEGDGVVGRVRSFIGRLLP